MFIEFVEALRCVQPHEESWLVASADRMSGRSIVAGQLGCPTCGARYSILDGVLYLTASPGAIHLSAAPARADAAEVLRLAALLGLAEPGGTVLLAGGWGHAAGALGATVDVHLLLVDPPFAASAEEGVSVLRTDGRLSLAASSVRGVAIDEPTRGMLPAAARALRGRGRLVAPAAAPLPPGVVELARDARHWVAERDPVAASGVVALGRAAPRPGIQGP